MTQDSSNDLTPQQVWELIDQRISSIAQNSAAHDPALQECLPLLQALDRVLAQDITSPLDVPPHHNSAMDGYAFMGSALGKTYSEDVQLQVVGTALAGKAWSGAVSAGQCVRITTGAVMPAGLDTVVPQEMVQPVQHATPPYAIRFKTAKLKAGDNRRLKGEDVAQGSVALHQGQRLNPAALGLMASLGLAQAVVFRRLKVAYFSTGDELLTLGEPPREGAVYDSNRYSVLGLLNRLGCEVLDLGVVRDDPVQLKAAFEQASAQADAIITSGGVSVGDADFTKTLMKELGDVAFWRIAMKPGRPMAMGRMGQAVWFGLPGNPVAVMVTFLALVRPALLKLMGLRNQDIGGTPMLKARSAEALSKKPGRTEYLRVCVTRHPDGQLKVVTTGLQGSGMLSSMVQAHGLMVLPHHQGNVAIGDEVDVMMFEGVM